jgi:hypothetical protein
VLEDARRGARRATRPLGVLVVVGLGALWVVLFAVWHGRRDNWHDLTTAAAWIPLVELVLAGGLGAAVSLSPGALMVGPPVRRVAWSLSVPVIATATLALVLQSTRPSPVGAFVATALACDVAVMMVAAPILALLLLGQRGRLLTSPVLVGAGAGVAAATFGHAVLHWACPWTDLAHLVWGHVLPSVPLALLGAVSARYLHLTSLGRRSS